MTRATIIWSDDAIDDLDEVWNYIARDNEGAADRTVDRIETAVELLTWSPLMGRVGRQAGTRELVVPDLPYIVVYIVNGDIVGVARVVHGARKWPPRPRR